MSSKTKSTLSETATNKSTPATPKISRLNRGLAKSETDSLSPVPKPRVSVERSPRSVTSKPVLDRRSPKLNTPPPDKQPAVPTRALKGSELQAQLNIVQEDLKKAKEKLTLLEKEKTESINELQEAQRLAEEANERVREALVAQKRAEENSEIEKFRALEMEQAGIEAAQKKEDEWQKELENVRNQHALDVSALLSATQELQKLKQELAMICDAKNDALSRADDASKIADSHAQKVETLSSELVRIKALLDSRLETESNETNQLVFDLKSEIETLNQELDKARQSEVKLAENEASMEQLNVELEAARMAESYAHSLAEEWKDRVEELEVRIEESNRLERSASESLESVMKQLEGSNDLLHDAESEIASLKEKVGLLEMSIGRQRGDLEESERFLVIAKEEASQMGKKVEALTSELETVKEEKSRAMNNEKLAAASVQTLLEEKNKLINELEISRDEEEKSKKAMESLASALHEVSSEAREAKEKLLSSQLEHENYENQIGDLKIMLEATKEKYENMLDDAKHEIDTRTNIIEQHKHEHQNSKADWEQNELHLMNSVKKSKEEKSSMEKEISRLVILLKEAEDGVCSTKEEAAELESNLKEAESEVVYLQEVLGEAKAESMKLKESLLDKETELQSVIQENEELQTREAVSLKKVEELSKLLQEAEDKKRADENGLLDKEIELQSIIQENEELQARESASLKKIEELSKLLEEATSKPEVEENGELTDSEKDYDMLPKVVEFSEQNGDGYEKKPKIELPPSKESVNESPQETSVLHDEVVQTTTEVENVNGKPNAKEEDDDSAKFDFKMWESCKIGEKDFSSEKEPENESFDEEPDSKTEGGDGESNDHVNGLSATENVDTGGTSPSKETHAKKKNPLLRKFGNLLKKKGSSNPSK